MKPARTLVISALFVLILLAAFVWLSPRMPAGVPTHWNAQGQVNGYMSPLGAMLTPMIVIAVLALLTLLLPAISPRGFAITPFGSVFALIMLALQAFVLVAALAVLLNAAGHSVPMSLVSMLGIGALLMVIGNYIGKVRKNFFIGIRTPWTLASDAVWERTHRIGGWLFMLAGAAGIALALAGGSLVVLVAIVLGVALVLTVYSYVAYRRLESHGP
jgi:uncharacterized membrane protein